MAGVPPPLFASVRATCGLVAVWSLRRVHLRRDAALVGDFEVAPVRWDLCSLASRGLVTVKETTARPDRTHPYSKEIYAVVKAFAARYGVVRIPRNGNEYVTASHKPGSANVFGGGLVNEILPLLAAAGVSIPRAILEVAPMTAPVLARRLHELEDAGIIRSVKYRSYQLIALDPTFFAAAELRTLLDAIVARDRPQYAALANEHRLRWPVLTSTYAEGPYLRERLRRT